MAYIKLDRKIFDHFLWTERRPKSRFEAWLDLIQLVSYTDNNELLIGGNLAKWERGQYPISYSYLATRWIWSIQKVRTYLTMLKNNKQVDTQTTGQITILTLCKYDQYNPVQQDRKQGDSTSEGKVIAGIKEDKEDKEDKILSLFSKFWTSYHEITGMMKSDKEAAVKYWKKLTPEEKQKAIANISFYFGSLNDKKYCKKARTYLSDKNFNDEFSTKTPENKKQVLIPEDRLVPVEGFTEKIRRVSNAERAGASR